MFEKVIEGLKPLVLPGTAPEAIIGILNGIDINDHIKDKETATKLLEENALLKSARDAHFTKGLETWRKEHYDKELAAAIEIERAKLNPTETKEQKEIRAIREELEKSKKEGARDKLMNKALLLSDEYKIPVAFRVFLPGLITEDEAGTVTNLKALSAAINQTVQVATEDMLKKHGIIPRIGISDPIPPNLDKQIEDAMKSNNLPLAIELTDKKNKKG
jgi:hypothetical protein